MQNSDQSNRGFISDRYYFIIAYILLLVLSITWSIDSSFIFLLGGLSTLFIFFGVRKYQPQRNDDHVYEKYNAPQTRQEEPQSPPTATTPNRPSSARLPRIVFIGVAMFMIVILGVVISVVFSDDDDIDSVIFYQQGDNYYRNEKYDSAEILFRQALAINPNYTDALMGYGNTKLATDQNDSAIIFYDKILAVEPDYEEALYQKGRVLYFQKNYDESCTLLKDLIAQYPTNFQAMQVIGDDFYNREQYDSALIWYNKAYSKGLRNSYLCYLMGYVYETKNETEKAVALYKETLEYDDTIADVYDRLGKLIPGVDGEVFRTKTAELSLKNK